MYKNMLIQTQDFYCICRTYVCVRVYACASDMCVRGFLLRLFTCSLEILHLFQNVSGSPKYSHLQFIAQLEAPLTRQSILGYNYLRRDLRELATRHNTDLLAVITIITTITFITTILQLSRLLVLLLVLLSLSTWPTSPSTVSAQHPSPTLVQR